ncbi:MAG: FAD:protein transferase [Actinomycetota bacterium]|jgi:thiamine biosynthesis lipoprotein|nr:FAD:protein transferase [Actinomycetota bacterium]
MGTMISLVVRGECPTDALDQVFAWFHWVDEVFSPYRDQSFISRLGRGEIAVADCPEHVGDVLARCEVLRATTGGYFDVGADPRWPLDPSGFVKGWSAEVASQHLSSLGLPHHAINAGGDVRVSTPAGVDPWSVGVAHPFLAGALTVAVDVENGAVATSGTYERGCHVFDPHTGAAALDLAAVTVIGPDLGVADAYATTALAMGPTSGPAWLGTIAGYDAFVVDAAGGAWWTPGFEARATGLPEAASV